MAFTYSATSLSSDIAKIRLEIGDTDWGGGPLPGGKNFSDEELQRYLDNEPNVYGAAAAICRMLAARWATKAYTAVSGGASQSFQSVAARWDKQAMMLEKRALRGGLYAGGISVDRKDDVEDDSDRVEPSFGRGIQRPAELTEHKKLSAEDYP